MLVVAVARRVSVVVRQARLLASEVLAAVEMVAMAELLQQMERMVSVVEEVVLKQESELVVVQVPSLCVT
jgi:hypothetical protein